VSSSLWLPGVAAGPLDEFVDRLSRRIEAFAREHEVKEAVVEVELFGGARFNVCAIAPEPGSGFLSLRCSGGENTPDELIVPVGAIARIELHATRDEDPRVGFSVPEARGARRGSSRRRERRPEPGRSS
jgi:hypothetical protein